MKTQTLCWKNILILFLESFFRLFTYFRKFFFDPEGDFSVKLLNYEFLTEADFIMVANLLDKLFYFVSRRGKSENFIQTTKIKVRVDAFSIRCKLFAYYANSCREISLFVDFGQNVWMLLHSPSHNKYPSNINLCCKYIYIIF